MAKGKGKGKLHRGLKSTSVKAPSEKPKGGSVNNGATRGKTAPNPKPMGPRTA